MYWKLSKRYRLILEVKSIYISFRLFSNLEIPLPQTWRWGNGSFKITTGLTDSRNSIQEAFSNPLERVVSLFTNYLLCWKEPDSLPLWNNENHSNRNAEKLRPRWEIELLKKSKDSATTSIKMQTFCFEGARESISALVSISGLCVRTLSHFSLLNPYRFN